jgi:hypothetical protein
MDDLPPSVNPPLVALYIGCICSLLMSIKAGVFLDGISPLKILLAHPGW